MLKPLCSFNGTKAELDELIAEQDADTGDIDLGPISLDPLGELERELAFA